MSLFFSPYKIFSALTEKENFQYSWQNIGTQIYYNGKLSSVNSVICSQHFNQSDYIYIQKGLRLNVDAVPTIESSSFNKLSVNSKNHQKKLV
jgi:hypothetical protein